VPVPKSLKPVRIWVKSWAEILSYDEISGYSRLSWTERKRLDLTALCMAFCSASFWRAAFVVLAAVLLAHILSWRFDLIGWQRDLLRVLPMVLAAPGVAAKRRRLIEGLLAG
jgi:hypothetical protein